MNEKERVSSRDRLASRGRKRRWVTWLKEVRREGGGEGDCMRMLLGVLLSLYLVGCCCAFWCLVAASMLVY